MSLAQLKAEYVTLREEFKACKVHTIKYMMATKLSMLQVKIQKIESQVFAKK